MPEKTPTTIAEMLDRGVELIEENTDGRQLSRAAKRGVRDRYRELGAHIVKEGGFDGALWKRSEADLEDYSRKLGQAAVAASEPEGLIGPAAMRSAMESLKGECPTCLR